MVMESWMVVSAYIPPWAWEVVELVEATMGLAFWETGNKPYCDPPLSAVDEWNYSSELMIWVSFVH